jgi:hypothetical protein
LECERLDADAPEDLTIDRRAGFYVMKGDVEDLPAVTNGSRWTLGNTAQIKDASSSARHADDPPDTAQRVVSHL